MHKKINFVANRLAPYVNTQASYTDYAGKHISIEFDNHHAVELSETDVPGILKIETYPKTDDHPFIADANTTLLLALRIASLPLLAKGNVA